MLLSFESISINLIGFSLNFVSQSESTAGEFDIGLYFNPNSEKITFNFKLIS